MKEITENQLHDFLTVDIARKIVSSKSCNFPEIFFGGHEFFSLIGPKSSRYLNALVLFSLITSEIFQLTHRYQFVVEVMTNVKHKRNDPMCVLWDSQVNEKMQFLILFLLLLLFALTF